jgi:DNA polymerase-3 subunit alpha
LSGLGTIPDLLERLQGGGWLPGQMSLFEYKSLSSDDWTSRQKMAAQEEILGCNLEAHPLEFAAELIATSGSITTIDAAEKIGQRVNVAGIRQSSHRIKTSKGELMMFLTIEDMAGVLDVIIFPEIYNQVKAFLTTTYPVFVTGIMEIDSERGEPYLRCENITLVN